MIKVVSVKEVRKIEAAADVSGLSYDTMMQNAGRAVAIRVNQLLAGRPDARVTVLVGPGNNGGDGLVAGYRVAQESKTQVRFYLLRERSDEDSNFKAVKDAGLFIALSENDHDFRLLRNLVASADLVIDALFGIGVKLPLKSEIAKVLRNTQQALDDEQKPVHLEGELITPSLPVVSTRHVRPYVVAVDCPSGLDCDTGAVDKNTIRADETITFIAAKPGLFQFPGAGMVGNLHIATIGMPEDLPEINAVNSFVVDAASIHDLLPERPPNSNKGTFGKTLVVAGSINYIGAAGLSSIAAYRSGTGLVTVAAPAPVVAALSTQLLEPTWLLLPHDMGVVSESAASVIQKEMKTYDVMLLGPGWGRETTTGELLVKLFAISSKPSATRSIGFVSSSENARTPEDTDKGKMPQLIIDADALNLLSEIDNWWEMLPARTVITPHPGEMARLSKMETAEVIEQRWEVASQKAAEWNVVLVLKGAHTLVADPDGHLAVLPFKTDALATAGTGDVLAGIIAGLLAQGMQPFEAAYTGVYIHGLAGEQAGAALGNTRSVIASDVLNAIPAALTLLEKS